MRDILLTGVPRGGTTLACHVINQCAESVALVEPYDVASLPVDPHDACSRLGEWIAGSRAGIVNDGAVCSWGRDGQLHDNHFGTALDERGLRISTASRQDVAVQKALPEEFLLAVKHNAAFVALLPWLVRSHTVFGVVRNPLSVLASWHTVDLPVRQGRVPVGERLDPELARRLDGEPEALARQLIVLDWFFLRLSRYLPRRILRYEELIETQGRALSGALGLHLGAPVGLSLRNGNRLYASVDHRELADALYRTPGAWRSFYSDGDVESVARELDLGKRG
ncbi:MAG: hypothetical protein HYV16_15950 [Gammaproteobacteria bacterium]|nr:hypothetical protein [Gammaproteobacteria bacterium]